MRPAKRAGLVLLLLCASSRKSDVDWPVYPGDLESRQNSELARILRGNVAALELAWVYRTGGGDPDDRSQI